MDGNPAAPSVLPPSSREGEIDSREWVNHSAGEYVRGDVFTNTVEGGLSSFKGGMKGVYHHCGEQHLHRYSAEVDFRRGNRAKLGVTESVRLNSALTGIVGNEARWNERLKKVAQQKPAPEKPG